MSESLAAFEREISRFPREVRKHFSSLPEQRGALNAVQVQKVGGLLGADTPRLMVELLPVAAAFARAPVSSFSVGAVAAGVPTAAGGTALYLGANFEVTGEYLGLTVHAEQVAAVNAWLNGEIGLSALAVSAVPCGYCRQFLYELDRAPLLNIVQPKRGPPGYGSRPLSQLLPDAFGPSDLGLESAFMTAGEGRRELVIPELGGDDLRMEALRAARASYAPYTGAFAGCAIKMAGGQIFVGRSVENAAYNPSLSAVQAAFATMNMSLSRCELMTVMRVVLVERATTSTQLPITERFLHALVPQADFEYYQAMLPKND
jgi:cytidine deaminase